MIIFTKIAMCFYTKNSVSPPVINFSVKNFDEIPLSPPICENFVNQSDST